MKRTSAATSLAVLFTTVFVLGIGSGAQADEPRSVRMKFSGTNVANDDQPAAQHHHRRNPSDR